MACLDIMYNQNKESQRKPHPNPPLISPRISFSNDFVDSSTSHRSYRESPVSTDFEFSVSNYSMITADELFSQGKLLPLKENCSASRFQRPTTLRDELLVEDEEDGSSLRPPKSTRWKGFLGLKKSHIGSRKIERGEGSSRPPLPSHPQEMASDGGSGPKMDEDEFGF